MGGGVLWVCLCSVRWENRSIVDFRSAIPPPVYAAPHLEAMYSSYGESPLGAAGAAAAGAGAGDDPVAIPLKTEMRQKRSAQRQNISSSTLSSEACPPFDPSNRRQKIYLLLNRQGKSNSRLGSGRRQGKKSVGNGLLLQLTEELLHERGTFVMRILPVHKTTPSLRAATYSKQDDQTNQSKQQKKKTKRG